MRIFRIWMILCAIALAGSLGRGAITRAAEMDHMKESKPSPRSIRITSKKLHESPGGVPRGWKFTIPAGDPKAGRAAFVKFECFKCHAVKSEEFPTASKAATDVGPELTGMGSRHPAEFFAQSIIDPNAVILTDKGYTGPDGKSIMPDYSQSMTVRELVDVVAYLKSLKETGGGNMEMKSAPAKKAPMKMPGGSGEGHMGK